MSKVKVAYLIVTKSFPGLLKQIEYDRALTHDLEYVAWDHFSFLDNVESGDLAQALPMLCRGVLGRKLFAWIWLLRNASRYDFVIVRHMEFDPFALCFAWFVRNRVAVHHSKEVLELRLIRRGWKGQAASLMERLTGLVAVRTAKALLCVTRELCEYQRNYRGLSQDFPIEFFPNGVVVDTVPILGDEREDGAVEIGFMSGSFAQWHGMDILLNNLQFYVSDNAHFPIKLHLIGHLNDDQLAQVAEVNMVSSAEIVVVYGRLEQDEYRKILGRCHIGIGSLAMNRIGMVEGATLKVREMLAMGLPLYSGHHDVVLPPEFPYYFIGNGDMREIVEFARTIGSARREDVRELSRPYIDKEVWIERLGDFLIDLKHSDCN